MHDRFENFDQFISNLGTYLTEKPKEDKSHAHLMDHLVNKLIANPPLRDKVINQMLAFNTQNYGKRPPR